MAQDTKSIDGQVFDFDIQEQRPDPLAGCMRLSGVILQEVSLIIFFYYSETQLFIEFPSRIRFQYP